MLVNVMNIAHFHKLCTCPLPAAFFCNIKRSDPDDSVSNLQLKALKG